MSVPFFVAQEIGRTLLEENVWMPTVTIDVSQSPEVADAGSLVFATTATESAHEDRPLWLSVDIDGTALRQTLQIDVN